MDPKFKLCSAAPTYDRALYYSLIVYIGPRYTWVKISFRFGALQKAQITYFHTSKISFCLTKIEISIQWSLGRPDLVWIGAENLWKENIWIELLLGLRFRVLAEQVYKYTSIQVYIHVFQIFNNLNTKFLQLWNF